jgi:predicted short-subunit dehydrogenase-like oxidoreductase (DUF2520 family)
MRKKITILGSGNVATFLGLTLRKANNQIMQVYSPNISHAEALAAKLNAVPIEKLSHIRDEADIYIIAVTDDAIEQVANELETEGKIVVHTSGATSKEVLAAKSAHYGVLYPYQSLKIGEVVDVSTMCIFFDGNDEETLQLLEELSFDITGYALQAGDEERLKYHLAAVVANNFANHLFALAEKILVMNGLDFENLKPVILQTAQQALAHSPAENQTGPAIRGDKKTIERHLELLGDDSDLKELYIKLSESIQNFHKDDSNVNV